MRFPSIAALSCVLAACASQPAAPPAPAKAPAAEPAAAPAAESAPATTVQEAWKAGYRVVNNDGQTMYCREQLKTGSHMRKETICLTEEELEDAREASRRNLEQMQQRLPPPHGT